MALRDGVRHRPDELLTFLCECVKIGTRKLRWWSYVRLLKLPFLVRVGLPSLETEIPKARRAYEELEQSPDPLTRQKARLLLNFCERGHVLR
jgi:hypothetical protein